MPRHHYTDAELEQMDKEGAQRRARQRYLSAINDKLVAAGLDLDELIELIEARQNREY